MGYSDRNFQGHLYKFTIFLSIRTVEKAQYMTYDKVRLTVASVVEKNESYLMVEEIDSGNTVINQPAGHVGVFLTAYDFFGGVCGASFLALKWSSIRSRILLRFSRSTALLR